MDTEIDPAQADRRRHRRFSVGLDLVYRLLAGQSGRGKLANISSGGLLFQCEASFPKGELIEVELDWPELFEDRPPLRLCVHGLIVRSDAAGTAVTINKYEFRAAS
jgi:hypothetical protein